MSIRARLTIALGLVLLAVWLSAAIFTKKTAFAQSRTFLEDQARSNVVLLLEAVSGQPITSSGLSLSDQRIVLLWREDALKLGRIDDGLSARLATYRGRNLDTVEPIAGDNWVIAARCQQADCAVVAIRDTERKFAIRRLVASIFLPMFGLFLLGLAAVHLAIRYALRPVHALAQSVNGMDPTKGLKLDDAPKAAELLPIVAAIDDMALRTREHLDREQSFLDTCAHEIRTPIAGLIAQVQSLQEIPQHALSKSMKAHLTFIERSASRAGRIANQFLGLAKTRNRVADESKTIRFDIVELVRTISAEAILRHGSLEISVQSSSPVWVLSDPLPIELVLRNLIDNTQRHANRNDIRIELTVLCEDQHIVLRAEDNGQGVPPEDLPKLGNRFFRGSSKRAPEDTGAGLGLSIVRDVAASFGGSVSFERSQLLGGLAVSIRLKLQIETKAQRSVANLSNTSSML